MAILVLWDDDDHRKRAELLAQTYNGVAHKISDTVPVKVPGVTTISFWGHGDAASFCHKSPQEFLDVVSAWKKVNPQIDTVEMISCNLRHRQGTRPDSYTTQVVTRLKRKHAGIVFKAFPVAVTKLGVPSENSILKWHPGSQTWAYVGTPGKDDRYMFATCRMVEDHMPPRGVHAGYVRAHNTMRGANYFETHKFGKDALGSIVPEACSLRHVLCVANNASVMSGTIGTLRWALTEIK